MLAITNSTELKDYLLSEDDYQILYEIAFFSLTKGIFNIAEAIFNNLHTLRRNEPVVFIGLAMTKLMAGCNVEAEKILLSALREVRNRKDEIYLYLALCYFIGEKYIEAQTTIQNLLNNHVLTESHIRLAAALQKKCRSIVDNN